MYSERAVGGLKINSKKEDNWSPARHIVPRVYVR